MDGAEWLIFEANRAGSAGNEKTKVKLGVSLIHRLRFEAGENAENRAGAGGAFALETFKGIAETHQAFLHLHGGRAKRAIFHFRDAHAGLHRLVEKFIFLESHDEANDPWCFDGTRRVSIFGPGRQMPKDLA